MSTNASSTVSTAPSTNDKASIRDRIAELQADYIRAIDRDELERWPDFFTDDCFYTVTTAENQRDGLAGGLIWANRRTMLLDRVSALRHANVYERQSYRHMVGLPWILPPGADGVPAETPFMVARIMHDGVTDLFVTGVYQDLYVDTDAGLKLKRRVVVLDSSRVDTLLAVPL